MSGAAGRPQTRQAALAADAVGLGLRRPLLADLASAPAGTFDFLECAPENWIGVGGSLGEAFSALVARHPMACHGLSLSIGGAGPLDEDFLQRLRSFLDRHQVHTYSEHLSACGDSQGHLYDLLPLPFTDASVRHVAQRVVRVQQALGRRIALENISYYATVDTGSVPRMGEIEFIVSVLETADCDLLLDVNNIVVNAANHGYDASGFLRQLPAARIRCIHVAGHRDEPDGLKIDTHGAAVDAAVWRLLDEAYGLFGPRPTVLERDFNLPPFDQLAGELAQVRRHLAGHARQDGRAA